VSGVQWSDRRIEVSVALMMAIAPAMRVTTTPLVTSVSSLIRDLMSASAGNVTAGKEVQLADLNPGYIHQTDVLMPNGTT
jgi:hypothetical protein